MNSGQKMNYLSLPGSNHYFKIAAILHHWEQDYRSRNQVFDPILYQQEN